MSEKTDFVFFFEETLNLPPRRVFVEQMLSCVEVLSPPAKVMLFNYETGKQNIESWERSTLLSSALKKTEILTVYGEPRDANGLSFSLSITERHGSSAYNFALEKSQILHYPIEAIEYKLIAAFGIGQRYTSPVLFVGSEIGWNDGIKTELQAVQAALDSSNESYWVVSDKKSMETTNFLFEVAAHSETWRLLRNRLVLTASGFTFSAPL